MNLYKNDRVIEEDLHKCYVDFANQDDTWILFWLLLRHVMK